MITAAAAIMICVFASFALGDERVLKLFELSLATAVFLDAFVVRSLLLPSVLELLGRRTGQFPAWLERRLPKSCHRPLANDRAREQNPGTASRNLSERVSAAVGRSPARTELSRVHRLVPDFKRDAQERGGTDSRANSQPFYIACWIRGKSLT